MLRRQTKIPTLDESFGGRFEALKEEVKIMNTEDHDLLVRVHEKLNNLTSLVSGSFTDHEARIRSAETDINYAKGAIKVLYAFCTLLIGILAIQWWTLK